MFALVFGGFTLTAYAQTGSQYIFPGITTNNNITIGNLNPVPTTASVSFYDNSGKLNSLSLVLIELLPPLAPAPKLKKPTEIPALPL